MALSLIAVDGYFVVVLAAWWRLRRSAYLLPHRRRGPSSFVFHPGHGLVARIMAIITAPAVLILRGRRLLTGRVVVPNGRPAQTRLLLGAQAPDAPPAGRAGSGWGRARGRGLVHRADPGSGRARSGLSPGVPSASRAVPAGGVPADTRAEVPVVDGAGDVRGDTGEGVSGFGGAADLPVTGGPARRHPGTRRCRSAARRGRRVGSRGPHTPSRRPGRPGRGSPRPPVGGRREGRGAAAGGCGGRGGGARDPDSDSGLGRCRVGGAGPGGHPRPGPGHPRGYPAHRRRQQQQQQDGSQPQSQSADAAAQAAQSAAAAGGAAAGGAAAGSAAAGSAAAGSAAAGAQQQAAQQQAAQQQAAQQQAAQQQAAQQQAAQQQAAQQQAAQQAALAAKHQAALAAAQAKAQAKAQARAAKLAAQQAAAGQRAGVVWARRGRPKRLVIVRTTSIDSVSGGSLVQRVARTGGTVSPAALDAAIPSSWMTIEGATARLNAAVVLSPGTLLDVEGVKTLQLAGGADPADAAILYTGSGRIQLRGVTVTSVDPASGQPVGPDAAGRPYIVVAGLGRLDATDATISDLGTKPVGDNHGRPALAFGRGSTGVADRHHASSGTPPGWCWPGPRGCACRT